jgi:zinc transport system substrate-binding protein
MRLIMSTLLLMVTASSALSDVKVMTSIKPVHSLVASVMEGVGTPGILVTGADSPHTYSLKPSDAEALQQANVIFWVGHELEAFLEKPVQALGNKAKVVSLMDEKGITTLPPRKGNNFDKQEHEGEEALGHDHAGDEKDAHIWLDPDNAKAMVTNIAEALSEADSANASTYQANATKTLADIDAMSAEITNTLAPAKGKGFIVFHDAYHYFEERFGVEASGAISINPENPPGAKGIANIRASLNDGKIQCVFSEPQFDSKLVGVILEGTTVKSSTLDPVGATLDPSPELYGQVMRSIAKNLVDCLG